LAAGAFLGIFSPLLFVVSGVAMRGDLTSTKCPYCAERIKPEALVCKHCGREVPGESKTS
jgi:predicted amidophosphoribosyltransferase